MSHLNTAFALGARVALEKVANSNLEGFDKDMRLLPPKGADPNDFGGPSWFHGQREPHGHGKKADTGGITDALMAMHPQSPLKRMQAFEGAGATKALQTVGGQLGGHISRGAQSPKMAMLSPESIQSLAKKYAWTIKASVRKDWNEIARRNTKALRDGVGRKPDEFIRQKVR
jgi:hypothetical protein